MEIRMTKFDVDWSCRISLRKEYDGDVKKDIPEETRFGEIITKPSDVEIAARRAQKALLNPKQKPAEDFLYWDFKEDDAASNELKFTKNVVCLDIKEPNV